MFRPTIVLFGFLLSSAAFATEDQYVVGLTPGWDWVSGNKTQTLNLEPDVQKTYTANNNTKSFPSLEFFLGWQKAHLLKHKLIGQIGVDIAAAGNAKLKGNIWDEADPAFNDFTYSYQVQHTQVAIKGRLIGDCGLMFEPYISGSIGVGFNRAYNFTINPLISPAVVAPLFHSNTTSSFIYTIGIGLQKSLSQHFQAAIGYEFANWGKTQLSRATGQTTNQAPSVNPLYAQQIQLSLYYIF